MDSTIGNIPMKMTALTNTTFAEDPNQFVCLPTLPMAEDSFLPLMEVFRQLLPHIYLHTIWEFLQNLFNLQTPKIIIE